LNLVIILQNAGFRFCSKGFNFKKYGLLYVRFMFQKSYIYILVKYVIHVLFLGVGI